MSEAAWPEPELGSFYHCSQCGADLAHPGFPEARHAIPCGHVVCKTCVDRVEGEFKAAMGDGEAKINCKSPGCTDCFGFAEAWPIALCVLRRRRIAAALVDAFGDQGDAGVSVAAPRSGQGVAAAGGAQSRQYEESSEVTRSVEEASAKLAVGITPAAYCATVAKWVAEETARVASWRDRELRWIEETADEGKRQIEAAYRSRQRLIPSVFQAAAAVKASLEANEAAVAAQTVGGSAGAADAATAPPPEAARASRARHAPPSASSSSSAAAAAAGPSAGACSPAENRAALLAALSNEGGLGLITPARAARWGELHSLAAELDGAGPQLPTKAIGELVAAKLAHLSEPPRAGSLGHLNQYSYRSRTISLYGPDADPTLLDSDPSAERKTSAKGSGATKCTGLSDVETGSLSPIEKLRAERAAPFPGKAADLGNAAPLVSCMLALDDTNILIGSPGRLLRVFDVTTGRLVRCFERAQNTFDYGYMAMLPRGRVLVASKTPEMWNWDQRFRGVVAIYDIASGKLLQYLHAHDFPVTAAAVARDGRLLTGSGELQADLSYGARGMRFVVWREAKNGEPRFRRLSPCVPHSPFFLFFAIRSVLARNYLAQFVESARYTRPEADHHATQVIITSVSPPCAWEANTTMSRLVLFDWLTGADISKPAGYSQDCRRIARAGDDHVAMVREQSVEIIHAPEGSQVAAKGRLVSPIERFAKRLHFAKVLAVCADKQTLVTGTTIPCQLGLRDRASGEPTSTIQVWHGDSSIDAFPGAGPQGRGNREEDIRHMQVIVVGERIVATTVAGDLLVIE